VPVKDPSRCFISSEAHIHAPPRMRRVPLPGEYPVSGELIWTGHGTERNQRRAPRADKARNERSDGRVSLYQRLDYSIAKGWEIIGTAASDDITINDHRLVDDGCAGVGDIGADRFVACHPFA
jgi:hypothetical protein